MPVMKASVTFNTVEYDKLKRNVNRVSNNLDDQISLVCSYFADWGTAWMKINAPWTDDTGAARASLIAIAASQGSQHEITVINAVSYGIWLEVANSGRFQILGPAMRTIGANLMKSMQGILDGKPPNVGPPVVEIPPVARKTARPKQTTNKSGNRRSRKAYGQRNRRRNP
jgi:hypothetical protein